MPKQIISCLALFGLSLWADGLFALCQNNKLDQQAFRSSIASSVVSFEAASAQVEKGLYSARQDVHGAYASSYLLLSRSPSRGLQWELDRVMEKANYYGELVHRVGRDVNALDQRSARFASCVEAARWLRLSLRNLQDHVNYLRLVQSGWAFQANGDELQLVSNPKKRKRLRKKKKRDWNPEELLIYMPLMVTEGALDAHLGKLASALEKLIHRLSAISIKLGSSS